MAGVFEVEIDGVEHDHGLEHHDQPNQVRLTCHTEVLHKINPKEMNFHWITVSQLETS